jgi:sec-independent protein translocase protein TatA
MYRNPLVDMMVVLLVVLLFFGPKRLPMLARSLGDGVREFKDSITGGNKSGDDGKAALTEAQAADGAAASATTSQSGSAQS